MMPDALIRGDVVACAQAVGVIWSAGPDEVTVLPIGRGDGMRRRGEVPIEMLSDQVAAGLTGRRLVIHADMPVTAPRAQQVRRGRIPGALMCKVVHAVARSASELHFAARWQGEREGRMSRLAGLRSAV
jgi:hypothetical protein